MYSFLQSQPNEVESHWCRETKLSRESPGNHWYQQSVQASLFGKCLVMLFLSEFLSTVRGKEQHTALGVGGSAWPPAIASLGLRKTSLYQFKRYSSKVQLSPTTEAQPHTWTRFCSGTDLSIVGGSVGWFPRALPLHASILCIFLAAPQSGVCTPQHIVFLGISL